VLWLVRRPLGYSPSLDILLQQGDAEMIIKSQLMIQMTIMFLNLRVKETMFRREEFNLEEICLPRATEQLGGQYAAMTD
jgi:hypothetical protein